MLALLRGGGLSRLERLELSVSHCDLLGCRGGCLLVPPVRSRKKTEECQTTQSSERNLPGEITHDCPRRFYFWLGNKEHNSGADDADSQGKAIGHTDMWTSSLDP